MYLILIAHETKKQTKCYPYVIGRLGGMHHLGLCGRKLAEQETNLQQVAETSVSIRITGS
jgi:hypothetical protein